MGGLRSTSDRPSGPGIASKTKSGSVLFSTSQISVRTVHLLRWLFIVLAVCAVLVFWYWHRLNVQNETNIKLGLVENLKLPSLRNVGPQFILGEDDKKIRILSGSLHYFRVVPEYWEDRLLKMRACGLNTVTLYVAWNMHEQIRGEFDFTGQLDLVAFLNLAKKVGLYVILRPGPYICSEWEFGGLPSWLLSDDEMKVRTMYPLFIDAMDKYFDVLMPKVEGLQYHRGGPIIAFQVENEYGSYGSNQEYMRYIKESMEKRNIKEMFMTSDHGKKDLANGRLPGVLMTANFMHGAKQHLKFLKEIQGEDKPMLVMEFWSGWFDHWGEKHHFFSVKTMANLVRDILDMDGSINFYMFHGGTNFGFMNGALKKGPNIIQPDITSYDYDAPIAESGDLTEKYYKVKEVLKEHTPKGTVPDNLPSVPTQIGKVAYGDVTVTHYITLAETEEYVGEPIKMDHPVVMEKLPINKNGGQGYGFLLYRSVVDHKLESLKLTHPPNDRAQVFLNSKQVGVMTRIGKEPDTKIELKGAADGKNTLELLVENTGRMNYGPDLDHERKGILGDVYIDGKVQQRWDMLPFEFKRPFLDAVSASSKWKDYKDLKDQPALFKAVLDVPDSKPKDTFVDMTGWGKGVIFINGFNLGRYWNIGPTVTYYLPGPLLKKGKNEILILELHRSGSKITFTDRPNLGERIQVVDI